jgi:phosphatidylglycerophosphate synthase
MPQASHGSAAPRRTRIYDRAVVAARPTLRDSRKQRAAPKELLCELVFRPLAHVVVLALLPLRVPPPAVVLAAAATGLAAAVELAREEWLIAAALLQVKTVLDNADGQLARAAGKESVLGRYLDSESDLLVNAALFAALGHVTGEPWLALVAFVLLTLVLSVDFNLERLYRREHGDPREARPPARGAAAVLAGVYDAVYAPQDRLVEWFVELRLRRLGAGPEQRLAYHDRATLAVLANFGLSTQLAVLGACLVAGAPGAYLWIAVGCGLALIPLALRRERRARA